MNSSTNTQSIPWLALLGIYFLVCVVCFGLYMFEESKAAVAGISIFTGIEVLMVGGFWFWEWATPRNPLLEDSERSASDEKDEVTND